MRSCATRFCDALDRARRQAPGFRATFNRMTNPALRHTGTQQVASAPRAPTRAGMPADDAADTPGVSGDPRRLSSPIPPTSENVEHVAISAKHLERIFFGAGAAVVLVASTLIYLVASTTNTGTYSVVCLEGGNQPAQGVEIWVDDAKVCGAAPCSLTLDKGQHRIQTISRSHLPQARIQTQLAQHRVETKGRQSFSRWDRQGLTARRTQRNTARLPPAQFRR